MTSEGNRLYWRLAVGVSVLGSLLAGGLGLGARSASSAPPAAVSLAAFSSPAAPGAMTMTRAAQTIGERPLSFEENRGQTDPAVRFLSRGDGYSLFLTPTEAVLALRRLVGMDETEEWGRSASDPTVRHPATARPLNAGPSATVLRVQFVGGADPKAEVQGEELLPGKSHYFVGNDPAEWRVGVSSYARVRYRNVYPGIDIVYYGNQRRLEYDFVVAPGADPRAIRLGFAGADRIEVDSEGELVLHTAAGAVRQRKPFLYQEIDGVRRPVSGHYVLHSSAPDLRSADHRSRPAGPEIGFEVAGYDVARPLVIDPLLLYSSYLGGSDDDEARGIAVDAAGNILLAGVTRSVNFPVAAAVQGVKIANSDAFVTKLSADGRTLLYSTYLGGSGLEGADAIAVDAAGNAYITGGTSSAAFPVTAGAFQTRINGDNDAFVTKLDPQGRIVYSTFLGGPENTQTILIQEEGRGIAVDGTGNAYVTGITSSLTFPVTPTAFQLSGGSGAGPRTSIDNYDAFLSVLNADGAALLYSTYIAGNGIEYGDGVAIDRDGNALVTGKTISTNFPTRNAFQPTYGGTGQITGYGTVGDAFIVKLNPFQERDASFVYGSYIGGDAVDAGFAVAVDVAGNAYVTGRTNAGRNPTNQFPTTPGAFMESGSPFLAYYFVTKVDPTGALVYSTLLGETGGDFAVTNGVTFLHIVRGGIAVDPAGNAWITGAGGFNFPQVNSLQPSFGGSAYDVFITQLDATGSTVLFSTLVGGNFLEHGEGIALDGDSNVYVAGRASSPNFPVTPNALQTEKGDNNLSLGDAFVLKITPTPAVSADLALVTSDGPDPVLVGRTLTYTLTATNLGPDIATDVRITDTLPASVVLVSASGGCSGTPKVTCALGSLAVGASATVTIEVTPAAGGQITNRARVSTNEFDPDSTNNFATAVTTVDAATDLALAISDSPDPLTSAPDPVTSSRQNVIYTLTVTNNGPSPATGVTVTDTLAANTAFFNASGGCRVTSRVVTCAVPGTLAPGGSAQVMIAAKPIATGEIRNTASVAANQADPNSDNNTASAVTANAAVFADLSVTMTATPVSARLGQRTTYTMKVKNNGPMAAPGVVVYEAGFAPGNQFVSATTSRGKCTGSMVATCDIGTLATGATAMVKVVRKPTIAGEVSHAVAVRGAVHDPNFGNDSAVVVTRVAP